MNVSIVTVCFNSADTIEHTIRSVQGQDYEHIEHIIIDGGSTDGTQSRVAGCNGQIRKFISEPDRGIYDAMNKGLHLAEGEIVGFLNADDVYVGPKVVSEVVAAIEAHHVDAVYGDLIYVDPADSSRIVRYWQAGPYRPGAFRNGWVPPHPTFFCRTALYREVGGYDPTCRIAGDFELMLRFVEKHKIRVHYLSKCLVHMRARGRGNTLRGIIRGNREIIQAFRRNGMAFPPGYFCAKFFRKARQFVQRPEGER